MVRTQVMATIVKGRAYFIYGRPRIWFLAFLSLTSGLSSLLSMGPQIQVYAIALPNSGANSIYATAYRIAGSVPYSPRVACLGPLLAFPIMACVIAAVSLRSRHFS